MASTSQKKRKGFAVLEEDASEAAKSHHKRCKKSLQAEFTKLVLWATTVTPEKNQIIEPLSSDFIANARANLLDFNQALAAWALAYQQMLQASGLPAYLIGEPQLTAKLAAVLGGEAEVTFAKDKRMDVLITMPHLKLCIIVELGYYFGSVNELQYFEEDGNRFGAPEFHRVLMGLQHVPMAAKLGKKIYQGTGYLKLAIDWFDARAARGELSPSYEKILVLSSVLPNNLYDLQNSGDAAVMSYAFVYQKGGTIPSFRIPDASNTMVEVPGGKVFPGWKCSSCGWLKSTILKRKCLNCATVQPTSPTAPRATPATASRATPATAPRTTTSSYKERIQNDPKSWKCPVCSKLNDQRNATCFFRQWSCTGKRP